MLEITTADEQDRFVANNRKCVIFMGSVKCGHCISAKPFVENLIKKYPNVKFAHVEVSKVKVDGLKGVPVFIGYRNGDAVNVVTGYRQRDLEAMVAKL